MYKDRVHLIYNILSCLRTLDHSKVASHIVRSIQSHGRKKKSTGRTKEGPKHRARAVGYHYTSQDAPSPCPIASIMINHRLSPPQAPPHHVRAFNSLSLFPSPSFPGNQELLHLGGRLHCGGQDRRRPGRRYRKRLVRNARDPCGHRQGPSCRSGRVMTTGSFGRLPRRIQARVSMAGRLRDHPYGLLHLVETKLCSERAASAACRTRRGAFSSRDRVCCGGMDARYVAARNESTIILSTRTHKQTHPHTDALKPTVDAGG